MAFHLATASAAALTAAGSYAFIKTGSKASLIGSLGLGSVFLASAYLVKSEASSTQQVAIGHGLGAFAGFASIVVGLSRWKKSTSKSMPLPVIILLTIGAVNFPYQAYKTYQWSR